MRGYAGLACPNDERVRSRGPSALAVALLQGSRRLPAVAAMDVLEQVEYWIYRLGGFVALNLLDDPAWLALIFC